MLTSTLPKPTEGIALGKANPDEFASSGNRNDGERPKYTPKAAETEGNYWNFWIESDKISGVDVQRSSRTKKPAFDSDHEMNEGSFASQHSNSAKAQVVGPPLEKPAQKSNRVTS
jgi:hypothetical protein